MKAEDLLVLGLAGVIVFMFMRQSQTTVIPSSPTTPQGTSYPLTTLIPLSTSQGTPASYFGGRFYIDANGKTVVCPPGQYVSGCGVAGSPYCLAPGQFVG